MGDRQISSEGNTGQPYISPDGRIFYLAGHMGGIDEISLRDAELWAADQNSGRAAPVLPGVRMGKYVVAPDGKAIAWSTEEVSTGDGGLWYAPLDQRTPPRILVRRDVLTICGIGASGNIYYVAREGSGLSTYRVARDGTEPRRIGDASLGALGGPTISPDEQWLVTGAGDRYVPAEYAQALTGGRKVALCSDCDFVWSPDGKSVIVNVYDSTGGPGVSGVTGVIPLPPGNMLPVLPAEGIKNLADLKKIPGVRLIPYTSTSPGLAGSYAYTKAESLANLYRIPLP
jgi:Tol biopolymer transport system component